MAPEDPRQNWAAPGSSNGGPGSESADSQTAGGSWGQPQQAPGGPAPAGAMPPPGSMPPPPGQGGWGGQGSWGAAQGGGAQGPNRNFSPMQAHKPGIIPLRAMRLSEILDGAFKAIRHNPKVIFGVTLPVALLTALLQTIITLRMIRVFEYDYIWMDNADPFEEMFRIFDDSTLLVTGVTLALSMLAIPIVTGVLTVSVSRSAMGQKLSMREIWAMIKGRKAALLGASLITTLLALSPFAIMLFFIPLLKSNFFAGFLLMFALAPLIATPVTMWLTTRMLFVPQVVTLERQGVFASIKRGWLLTRGNFWRILGIYLLATVIASVVSSIISTPVQIVSMMLASASTTLSAALVGGSMIVTLLIVVPYTSCIAAILYIDVRMRSEGLDIELARAASEVS